MKKLIAFLMAAAIIISSAFLAISAFADDVQWRYDSDTATIYIFGSGDMDDYSSPYNTPWSTYLLLINNVVVEEGVNSIGNCAFAGAENLSNVSLADSVSRIGSEAFSSCPSLLELTLSPGVVNIGDVSFSKIGADNKTDFVLSVEAGSYALNYAISNGINFNCGSVQTGDYNIHIPKSTNGMKAYFPYEAKLNGTFVFYSVSKYDPLGYVYDENFNLIEENDDWDEKYNDSMESCDFSLSVNLQAGKTYYFATGVINPNMKADYSVFIKAIDYNVQGGIYLMANPEGDLTDIKMTNAYMNDVPTGGEYSLHITEVDYTVKLECNGAVWYYTFSPDFGSDYDIPFMGCDLNEDRIVNAKDYAIMLKTDYDYKYLFDDFLNYKY